MGFGRAIVIGPEPMIQRHHGFPVVALEVAVMQVMEITAGTGDPEVPLDNQLLEPGMPLGWRGSALCWAFISTWMGCEGTIQ